MPKLVKQQLLGPYERSPVCSLDIACMVAVVSMRSVGQKHRHQHLAMYLLVNGRRRQKAAHLGWSVPPQPMAQVSEDSLKAYLAAVYFETSGYNR